jgi:hypothetical protein
MADASDVVVTGRNRLPHGTVYELDITVADPRAAGRTRRCAAALTVPEDARGTLHILVHGGTYNRWYWHPETAPEKYSYVRAAAQRGYATINVDRIGSGRSDHPDGDELGFDLHAATVNSIALLAREGMAGLTWNSIIGVGHSIGTMVLMKTLSGEHTLDAAVLTGISHQRTGADPVGLNIPAGDDKQFAHRNVTGYFAMPAEQRERFYYLPTTDEEVLLADKRHRDVVGAGDLRSMQQDTAAPCGATVPICVALGTRDWLSAAENDSAFRSAEAAWYPQAPSVDFFIYEDTGHNINLHQAGPRAVTDLLDWAQAVT